MLGDARQLRRFENPLPDFFGKLVIRAEWFEIHDPRFPKAFFQTVSGPDFGSLPKRNLVCADLNTVLLNPLDGQPALIRRFERFGFRAFQRKWALEDILGVTELEPG